MFRPLKALSWVGEYGNDAILKTEKFTLALDAMGGDVGPAVVVAGAALAIKNHPNLHILFYGDQDAISAQLDKHPNLKAKSEIHHAEISIAMYDKPSQALRRGRNKSGMWHAIAAVHSGEAAAVVSAGNTGALMAMSRFILRTLPGIERPAIAAIWPTLTGQCVVLDVGATVGADSRQLIEFAVMGEAMASCLFEIEQPRVGLLNIGVEEVKGNEDVREAGRLLRELNLPLNYAGFVEGDDIGKGTVDVVVTEGFTGNVALKAAEGTAKQMASFLRNAMKSSVLSMIGAMFARGAFAAVRDRMDPRKHNGGVFLGLNGVVVKSHGGTDALGFATAIDVAIDMVRNGLTEKIASDVEALNSVLQHQAKAAE